MDTDHIRNTIMMLERKYERFNLEREPIYWQLLSEELKRRGKIIESIDANLESRVAMERMR